MNNKFSLTVLFIFISGIMYGQINMEDSTVQVIAYWDKNEKQSYTISNEKYKVKGADTTNRTTSSFDVEITIIDSSEKSYTIEWVYKNFRSNDPNKLIQKLASVSENLNVIIKTDEMGAFVEIVNWKEVRDDIKKGLDALKTEFKDIPKIDEIFSQVQKMFSSKEEIENGAIKEIQQFYSFHGAKYKLGEEVNAKIKVANLYGGEPLEADVTVLLDEINEGESNSVLRLWQTVDPKQLTDAAFEYVKSLAKTVGSKVPSRSEFPDFGNEVRSASKIHAPSGWVLYAVETKEIKAEDAINFEERIIDLK